MNKGFVMRHLRLLSAGALLCVTGVGAILATAPSPASAGSKVIHLTVWDDAPRQVGFLAYEKLHPNIKMSFEEVASGSTTDAVNGVTLEQKNILANRTGSGWPDIAFIGTLNEVPEQTFPTVDYPANLKKLVPASIINNYPPGVLNVCETNGEIICLRNDNAQNVLWYNAPLMAKWGYTVPTTWAQYEALGEEVATQHPGTIIGDMYGQYGLAAYYWAGQCPYEKLVGNLKVEVDMSNANCVNMSKMLDTLVQDGTVSTVYPFAASFATILNNALMMPAADWFGAYVFDGDKQPADTWAAAATPTWTAGGAPSTGDEGGGVYMLSRHMSPATEKAALAVIEYMATNTTAAGFQLHSVTTPAYGPAEAAWAANGEAGYESYFYANPAPVFKAMAAAIWPGDATVGYDDNDTFADTMTQAAVAGGSLVGELKVWQTQATALLQAAGYTVVH